MAQAPFLKLDIMWQELLRLLRWELPVEVESFLTPTEAIARIIELCQGRRGWRRFLPFGFSDYLVGRVTDLHGAIRTAGARTDLGVRTLWFQIEPSNEGSRLQGKFQIHGGLWFYEVFCLVMALFLEISQIYWLIRATSPQWTQVAWGLLSPFLVIPFLWCYVRVGLWFGRKREAKLISLVTKALTDIRIPSPSDPHVRQVSPPTPTEVFIRPRHESPGSRLG